MSQWCQCGVETLIMVRDVGAGGATGVSRNLWSCPTASILLFRGSAEPQSTYLRSKRLHYRPVPQSEHFPQLVLTALKSNS